MPDPVLARGLMASLLGNASERSPRLLVSRAPLSGCAKKRRSPRGKPRKTSWKCSLSSQVHAVEGDDGNTKYAPNYQLRYFDEVTELINSHTREELREEIASIQEMIDEWKSEFAVESQDELESSLTGDDLDSAAIRERNRILRQWERYEDNKRLLKHALELYDDARELYPGQNSSNASNSSTPLSQ